VVVVAVPPVYGAPETVMPGTFAAPFAEKFAGCVGSSPPPPLGGVKIGGVYGGSP
jgi:hypothetical protein